MDILLTLISQADHLKRIWTLCCQCAQALYGATPPSPAYALRTARLLFMTGAQETGFTWERQRAPQFESNIGGFGKWQVEPGSIKDSIDLLRNRPDLLTRATQWLFNDPHASDKWLTFMDPMALLWALRMDDNDKIALLFCRLHYLRIDAPIPESVQDQAAYYKTFYNTKYGAATIDQTLANYKNYGALLDIALQSSPLTLQPSPLKGTFA